MKRLTSLLHCSKATVRLSVSPKHYRGTVYIVKVKVDYEKEEFDNIYKVSHPYFIAQNHCANDRKSKTLHIAKVDLYYVIVKIPC